MPCMSKKEEEENEIFLDILVYYDLFKILPYTDVISVCVYNIHLTVGVGLVSPAGS